MGDVGLLLVGIVLFVNGLRLFLLLGLGVTAVGAIALGRFTGWYLVFLGVPSRTVAGVLLLRETWSTEPAAWGGALAVVLLAAALSAALARRPVVAGAPASAVTV